MKGTLLLQLIFLFFLEASSQNFKIEQDVFDKNSTIIKDNLGRVLGTLKANPFAKNELNYYDANGKLINTLKKERDEMVIYGYDGLPLAHVLSDPFNQDNRNIFDNSYHKIGNISINGFDRSQKDIYDNNGKLTNTIKKDPFDKNANYINSINDTRESGEINSGISPFNQMLMKKQQMNAQSQARADDLIEDIKDRQADERENSVILICNSISNETIFMKSDQYDVGLGSFDIATYNCLYEIHQKYLLKVDKTNDLRGLYRDFMKEVMAVRNRSLDAKADYKPLLENLSKVPYQDYNKEFDKNFKFMVNKYGYLNSKNQFVWK